MIRQTLILAALWAQGLLSAQSSPTCKSSTAPETQGLYYASSGGYAIRVIATTRMVVDGFMISTNLDTGVLGPTTAQILPRPASHRRQR